MINSETLILIFVCFSFQFVFMIGIWQALDRKIKLNADKDSQQS